MESKLGQGRKPGSLDFLRPPHLHRQAGIGHLGKTRVPSLLKGDGVVPVCGWLYRQSWRSSRAAAGPPWAKPSPPPRLGRAHRRPASFLGRRWHGGRLSCLKEDSRGPLCAATEFFRTRFPSCHFSSGHKITQLLMDGEPVCYWEVNRVPDTRKVFCFGILGQVPLYIVSTNMPVYTETLTKGEKKGDFITKPKQKLNELTCYTVLP